jgi:periplasmic protein TonB
MMQAQTQKQPNAPIKNVYSMVFKPNNIAQTKLSYSQQVQSPSKLSLLIVILVHAGAIYLLWQQANLPSIVIKQTPPMLVSLIALPASQSEKAPEIVPIIEPTKSEVIPIEKTEKVVEKIRSIEKPAERLLEATADSKKEPEITSLQAAPVLEDRDAAEVTAIEEKVIKEDVFEPPRFGVAYLNNPAPAYPRLSKNAGEEGRVLMKVLVSAEGNAEDVQIETSSGSERLDNAAMNAVKNWRFIPAKKNNQSQSAYVLVPIKFSLDS